MKNTIFKFKRDNIQCLYNPYTLQKVYSHINADIDCVKREINRSEKVDIYPPEPNISCIQVAVTNQCNLRCAYCQVYNNPKLESSKMMTKDEAKEIALRFSQNLGDKGLLIITGGEPLLNWDVVDYLISQTNGTKVVFTNATLITSYMAKSFLRNNANVVVSIDGHARINDSARKYISGNPTFEQISKGIGILKDMGLEIGISMVCSKYNLLQLSEAAEYLINKFNPVSIGINLPHYTEYESSITDVDPLDYAKQICKIFELAKHYGIFVDQIARRLRPLVHEEFMFKDCLAYGSKEVYFPGGKVSNCINMQQKHPTNFSIWEDRMPINLNDCNDCYAIGICGGGCFFDALHRIGDGYRVDERHCTIVKALLEYLIWDIWDTCKVESPTKAQMLTSYEWILSRKKKLTISIGHDESDAGIRKIKN